MARYDISEVKARLSELVDKAMAGEEVVIVRDRKPLLRLLPFHDPSRLLKPGSGVVKSGWPRISTRRWLISKEYM